MSDADDLEEVGSAVESSLRGEHGGTSTGEGGSGACGEPEALDEEVEECPPAWVGCPPS